MSEHKRGRANPRGAVVINVPLSARLLVSNGNIPHNKSTMHWFAAIALVASAVYPPSHQLVNLSVSAIAIANAIASARTTRREQATLTAKHASGASAQAREECVTHKKDMFSWRWDRDPR